LGQKVRKSGQTRVMGQFVDERTCMFKEWAGGRLGYRGELPGVGFESVCKDAGGGIDKLRCGPFDHNEYGAAALRKRTVHRGRQCIPSFVER